MRQSLGYDVLPLVVSGNSLVTQVPLRDLVASNSNCLCGQECPVRRATCTSVRQLGIGVIRYEVGNPIGISTEKIQRKSSSSK
jgi:hypothetical protein